MRRYLIFFLLLLLFGGCKLHKHVHEIDVTCSRSQQYYYGEAFHSTYTSSDPIEITQITYHEDYAVEAKATRYIARTYYENPPYEVEWEGLRLKVYDLYSFEIWIDANAWPTIAQWSEFEFDLNSSEYRYGDPSSIKVVSDLSIHRIQGSENQPVGFADFFDK